MERNDSSFPKLDRCNRWSVGMDKLFYRTLNWAYTYLSMLGLKLIHVIQGDLGELGLQRYF